MAFPAENDLSKLMPSQAWALLTKRPDVHCFDVRVTGSPSCAWKLAHRDHLMYQWEWVRKNPVGQQDRNKEMFQNPSLRRIWTEQENTSRKRRVPELDAKICWVFL
jgi:hypothetical protein